MPKKTKRAFLFDSEMAILFRASRSTVRYWRFIERLPTVRIGRKAATPRACVAKLLEEMGTGIREAEIDEVIDGHAELQLGPTKDAA